MTFRLSTLSALPLVHIGVMPAGAQAASQSNEAVSLSVGASEMIVLSGKSCERIHLATQHRAKLQSGDRSCDRYRLSA